MIGTSFQSIDVENTISVQDIKASGLKGLDWDSFELGDTLMIWDASEQAYARTLYYAGDEQTDSMSMYGVEAGTWFDMDMFCPADFTLENGDAFWIVSSVDGANVTIAGEVPTAANSVTIVPGFNMIANPFPKTVKANELFAISGLKGLDWDSFELGDTLMIWSPEEQAYAVTLYYAGDEQTDLMDMYGAVAGGWFDMDMFCTAETEIPAGGAFWIVSSGNGTLTFK